MKKLKNKIRLASAFTLIEVMIAVSVTGFIMVAIALAMQAAVANFRANEDITKTSNMASQTLNRITADLRTASAVSVSEPATQCSLISTDGSDITYSFNSTDGKIYLITNNNTTDPDYVLCENVTSVIFAKTTAFDDMLVEYVQSVLIKITITTGDYTNTSSAAVIIRKNL